MGLTVNAFAARQGETVLRGSAIEESGAPAGFATALLTNAEGVLVVGTTAGEDGRFELKAPQGTYTLTVSLVGFKDASQQVVLNQAQQELPPVRLEEDKQLLGEAIVQAVMPKTKLTGEGLATSVHGSCTVPCWRTRAPRATSWARFRASSRAGRDSKSSAKVRPKSISTAGK